MKNILIIGGSSGVGESLVKRLKANNNLISTYHKNPQENSENVNFHEYDVISGSPSNLQIPEALDSIIYCPGTINLKPFNRYTEDELIDDFKINVLGFFENIICLQKASVKYRQSINRLIFICCSTKRYCISYTSSMLERSD